MMLWLLALQALLVAPRADAAARAWLHDDSAIEASEGDAHGRGIRAASGAAIVAGSRPPRALLSFDGGHGLPGALRRLPAPVVRPTASYMHRWARRIVAAHGARLPYFPTAPPLRD